MINVDDMKRILKNAYECLNQDDINGFIDIVEPLNDKEWIVDDKDLLLHFIDEIYLLINLAEQKKSLIASQILEARKHLQANNTYQNSL